MDNTIRANGVLHEIVEVHYITEGRFVRVRCGMVLHTRLQDLVSAWTRRCHRCFPQEHESAPEFTKPSAR